MRVRLSAVLVALSVTAFVTSTSTLDAQRVERGRLERGDETISGGEYIDVHTVSGRAGQRLVIDLRSSDFDPYLIVRGPGNLSEDNDDYQGSRSHSHVEVTLSASGEVRIGVTSYAAGETGAYELTITTSGGGGGIGGALGGGQPQGQGGAMAPPPAGGARTERGTLGSGDAQLQNGEYYDVYDFQGQSGQQVSFELTSSQFDTYLILVDPSDDWVEQNDDAEAGNTRLSRINWTLGSSGRWRVVVTSYAGEETGSYVLTMNLGGGGGAGRGK